jgi:hypothetical protein
VNCGLEQGASRWRARRGKNGKVGRSLGFARVRSLGRRFCKLRSRCKRTRPEAVRDLAVSSTAGSTFRVRKRAL